MQTGEKFVHLTAVKGLLVTTYSINDRKPYTFMLEHKKMI